jgi:hypothetical protein
VQKCNTLMRRKGVINMGIKLYNNLTLELRKVKGEREFQHKLRRYLQEHPFYTLHDYLSESQ